MSKKIFVISDLHLGHQRMCEFVNADGSKVRPWDRADDMDEHLIQSWNEVVSPFDTVYNLGDVVINRKALKTLARLNGDKVLIRGNHDIFKDEEYYPYFRSLRGCHTIKTDIGRLIMTHIPIHPDSIERFVCNVHGHTHANLVMKTNQYGKQVEDERYLNVCVEHTDYKPVLLEDLVQRIKERRGL